MTVSTSVIRLMIGLAIHRVDDDDSGKYNNKDSDNDDDRNSDSDDYRIFDNDDYNNNGPTLANSNSDVEFQIQLFL